MWVVSIIRREENLLLMPCLYNHLLSSFSPPYFYAFLHYAWFAYKKDGGWNGRKEDLTAEGGGRVLLHLFVAPATHSPVYHVISFLPLSLPSHSFHIPTIHPPVHSCSWDRCFQTSSTSHCLQNRRDVAARVACLVAWFHTFLHTRCYPPAHPLPHTPPWRALHVFVAWW